MTVTVYRAIPAGQWVAPFDMLRESYRRQRARGAFNAWRWNDHTQWALYASRDPACALTEANQPYTPDPWSGAVGLATSDLMDTGSSMPRWAVISFSPPPITSHQQYDGEAEGFLSRLDVGLLLTPRPAYTASRDFAADLRRWRGTVELIVPSAPAYNRRPTVIMWNHVWFGGNPGQFDPLTLPHGSQITLHGYA